MARAMGSGVCILCSLGQGRHAVLGVGSRRIAVGRGRPFSSKVFASDAPPKPFPHKLIENVRLRLGLKQRSSSVPVVEDEVQEKLARELEEEKLEMGAKSGGGEALWEQGERDLRAEEDRRPILTSPGFSFSAAGHLFPYHLGVCQCLIEHGYITESTPLAGSSAGALVCAVVAVGLDMSDALDAAKQVSQDCRTNGTAFRVGAVLRGIMEKVLPEDAHTRVNGRIRIAITQLFRQPRGLLVDLFDSKEDLINALHTSCFIPGYFAPRPVTMFRDRVCIDGGFTLFMPPTAAEQTIRICAFFPSAYKIENVQISPDSNPSNSRPGNQLLLSLAFRPAEDNVLDEMFRFGYEDALCWVEKQSD